MLEPTSRDTLPFVPLHPACQLELVRQPRETQCGWACRAHNSAALISFHSSINRPPLVSFCVSGARDTCSSIRMHVSCHTSILKHSRLSSVLYTVRTPLFRLMACTYSIPLATSLSRHRGKLCTTSLVHDSSVVSNEYKLYVSALLPHFLVCF